MTAERDKLMTHAWSELSPFHRDRQVELVEVDLRWDIADAQPGLATAVPPLGTCKIPTNR